MAPDLADSPMTGLYVAACGDAPVSNFGLFGSPERRVLFDLNDFDEAYSAPGEWDVRRLVASVWIRAGPARISRNLRADPLGSQGARVVGAQRVPQAQSDRFLGWVRGVSDDDSVPRDYYIRQFRDMKKSVVLESLTPQRTVSYGRLCAALLARAHCRTRGAGFIAGYLGVGGGFAEAMATWARMHADRAEQDYRLLERAVRRVNCPLSTAYDQRKAPQCGWLVL
ncbi:DUF2252 family protein [Nocardia sp. NPDC049220]|uniref:DUF2252 family protein n=1 Tax=Nocardia sp. NPDC049220 TaxID=3155273 RepID=UPI00340F13E1